MCVHERKEGRRWGTTDIEEKEKKPRHVAHESQRVTQTDGSGTRKRSDPEAAGRQEARTTTKRQ